MKHFNPKEYRANRKYIRQVRGFKLFTFFLSNVTTLVPFDENKRPWKPTRVVRGVQRYETTAIIDFVLPSGIVLRIPKGFEWDGASIPKFAQWIIGKPMGEYALAALIHDWLYSSKVLGDTKKGRLEADEYFLMAMKALDVAWWRRKTMYRAVRFGGGKPYHGTDNTHHCRSIFLNINKYNPWKDYKQFFYCF